MAGAAPALAGAGAPSVNPGQGACTSTVPADAAVLTVLGETPSAVWLKALLSAVPVAAAIADETLRVLALNPAFGATLDRSDDAIVGARMDDLLGLEREWAAHARAPEPGGTREFTARVSRVDGTAADLIVTVACLEVLTERSLHLVTLRPQSVMPPDAAPGTAEPQCDAPIRSRTLLDLAGRPQPFLIVEGDLVHGAEPSRQLERVAAVIRAQRPASIRHTYIVSIPFELLSDPHRAQRLVDTCRALADPLRAHVILMLDAVAKDIGPARLALALDVLRSLAFRLALALDSPDALPPALEHLGIGLLAVPAARLTDSYRCDAERLRVRCRQLRDAGIALLSRNCAAQADAESARRVPVDLISYVADPRQLPRSRLFALSGIAGPADRIPSLPHTAVIEATDSGIVYVDATDPDLPIVRVNPTFLRLTGYAEHEVLGRNCRFLQGEDTDPAAVAVIGAALRTGQPVRCELLNYRKDGTPFWNQIAISPVRDGDGRIIAFAGTLTDVTERREAQEAQDHFAQMLEGIADTVPGFVYQIRHRDGMPVEFTYLGRSAAALLGCDTGASLKPETLLGLILPQDRERLEHRWRQARQALDTLDLEFAIQRPDGERRWLRSRLRPTQRANGDVLWNGVTLDVTPEKAAQDELTYVREHDLLTHLPNATAFHVQLSEQLATDRAHGRRTALYMVDFVRFHEINDTYGMATGNAILTMIATRLQQAFPSGSRCYRLQADQFAVLGNAVPSEEQARQIAASAASLLSAPFSLPGGVINLPARIGLCVDAPDGELQAGAEGALEFAQRADIALHAAKRAARPGISLYNTDIDDRLRTHVIVKQSLRGAIERREFELHYQPIVNIKTGHILAAEALVRWNHPLLGMQTPDSFIPIAEESGLIGPLGEWILHDALRAAALCRTRRQPPLRIAVNVSGVQISDPTFVRSVEAALAHSSIDPHLLEFELTETFLIEHCTETSQALAALRALGVRIAIDDFGAGYSSFHYLRHLPVDSLKVDRSFIRDLKPQADGDISILKAMVAMAQSLGVELVIEGVETPYQRDVLTSIGCEIAQGYLFSRPGPLATLLSRLGEP